MRGKEVSKTHWERIIGAYLSGIRQRVISTQFGIPTSTVNDIIKKYKETGSTEPKKCSGRPKVLTERDTRALKFRSYLHSEGLGSYTVQKKLHLTAKHRTDRLRWCKEKKNWIEEWKQVVWSDESRFALFQSDGRARVWRSPGETYNKDCIQPTMEHFVILQLTVFGG
ncbi:helix-turn-helix domain-containing protein [Rhizophagus irregularis DAOM 181602=DAOM 197198]|nr:helix-turn-helix domain-containing protein [Rhizophagus irregularis DAOM 181602=DAOM 197198]